MCVSAGGGGGGAGQLPGWHGKNQVVSGACGMVEILLVAVLMPRHDT